ncbi:hypothetical protein BGZ94_003247 [Podila epigama]|nr:hypothetical protein BGZ94_003247 [Podila epigama]
MIYLRASSKRTVTILLGLCIIFVLFTLTPYSDKAISNLPNKGFRTSTEDQALEIERHRKEKEEWEKNNVNAPQDQLHNTNNKNNGFDIKKPDGTGTTTNSGEGTGAGTGAGTGDKSLVQNTDTPPTNGDNKEEIPNDGLPVEFSVATFPPTSQRILETKVGARQLDEFMREKQNMDAREAAVAYILRQANNAYRNTDVYSVVIKPVSKLPPSGDIHDYSSLARYFWKNENTPDGLPYIRRDGHPNPEMDSVMDYRLLRKVFRDCYYMGQAYFWTGEERYAEKIVFRINQWFLDEKTRMNPNLKYASLIFGSQLGRAQGVLDMFKVYGMFDALKMIKDSKALQKDPEMITKLQKWFSEYRTWIDGSVQANQEKNAHNNHGTYFTVQYLSILEFLGETEAAKKLAEESKIARVGPQIRKDGAQPHETIRPISFFYSTFNLQGLILLAVQADAHGVSLWSHRGPVQKVSIRINSAKSIPVEVGGGTIEDAIKYLATYAVKDPSEWPYPDSGTRNERDVLKMARVAALVYGKDKWQELIENLEAKVDESVSDEPGAPAVVEDGEPNGFMCELGVLSKGTLWHCYK